MLYKVSQALSRLIKPITVRDITGTKPTLSGTADSDQKNSNAQNFKRFENETTASATPVENEHAATEKQEPIREPGFRPGLTTAFLGLLSRLQEQRHRFRLKGKPYRRANIGGQPIKTLKKGMIVDQDT